MNVKRRSQKQEKSVAKQFDARTTIASGALWFNKADVRNDKYLIECKTTLKDHYSITAKVWEKLEDEAIHDNDRIPLLVVDLEDSDRYVIYASKYFSNERHPTTDGLKSFNLKKSYFDCEAMDAEVGCMFFTICGNKKNHLVCMPVNKFNEFIERWEKENGK